MYVSSLKIQDSGLEMYGSSLKIRDLKFRLGCSPECRNVVVCISASNSSRSPHPQTHTESSQGRIPHHAKAKTP